MAVYFVHDRQTDSAPLVAASADVGLRRNGTGWPEERSGGPAAGTGWPPADLVPAEPIPRQPAPRPEAYRRLWQPWGRKPPPRQALGRPYVWDGGQDGLPARPEVGHGQVPAADRGGAARREDAPGGADTLSRPAVGTERTVIGDHLRQLATWCQLGACIARYTDAAALGEADIRDRAVAAGWCLDAVGRLVCPSCQQDYPVWSARPLALRARDGRQARGATAVVGQHRRTY